MRFLSFSLVVVLIFSASLASSGQTIEEVAEREARSHAARQNFQPSLQTTNYDVVYHRAEWALNPAERYINGAITTYFKPLEENFNAIWFDLDESLVVDSVLYRQQKVSFEQTADKLLRVDLPKVLTVAVLDSVTVFYQGIPPNTGHGSFVQTTHSKAPIIWTLSEPYGARDWWPCKQSLTDKIDSIDIWVRTPTGNRVGSNGVLVSETQLENSVLYRWKHRYPIVTYLVAVATTNYVAFSNTVPLGDKHLEVLNYAFPESETLWRQQSESIVGMMQLFSELFGVYPFAEEKYGHAQFGWGGGMEHQTMSFMANLNYDLMAHELAHQWFGDKVTCGSWHDIWVNEGFATYLTGLTKEHLSTPDAWRNWKRSVISKATAPAGGSVWVPDTTNINRIFSGPLSYNKGAYLLHMLRWVVGDEAFYEGLRNYLHDPELAYGFALAEDVKRHLEATSGKNLDEFFRDWYYGEGYPLYDVIYAQNGNKVSVKINQTTSSTASVLFFEMPVPIYFSNSDGSQDSIVVFQHSSSGQVFEAELPFEATTVSFDPELWLLTNLPSIAPGEVTGLNNALQTKIQIYPNPTRNKIIVEANAGIKIQQLLLLNVEGKEMGRKSTDAKAPNEFDMRGLPAGTYLLKIETNKGWVTKRITKY